MLLLVLPPKLSFLAKDSLFKIPILSFYARYGKCIPITRENLADAKHSLSVAEDRLRDGRHVVLAPEGTPRRSKSNTSKGDENIAEFKKGPFHVAKHVPSRIVPIIFSGSYRILPPNNYTINAGTLYINFLQPISKEIIEAFPSYEELRLHVQKTMRTHAKARTDAEVLVRRVDNFWWIVGYTVFLAGLIYLTFKPK